MLKDEIASLRVMKDNSIIGAEINFLGLFDTVSGSAFKSDQYFPGVHSDIGGGGILTAIHLLICLFVGWLQKSRSQSLHWALCLRTKKT